MTNFLPEEFRARARGAAGPVPPRPYADIEARFARSSASRRASCSPSSSERPIASASIGQVHLARLPTGEGRGQGPVPRHRGDRAPRPAHAAPHLPHHRAGSCRTRASTSSTARSARWCCRSSTTAPRPTTSSASPRTSSGRADVALPKVRRELSTARVLTTEWMDGVQDHRPRAAQRARRRSRRARARRWSRSTASRSSPTASITPIRTPGTCWCGTDADGRAADDRVPRLRRGRRGVAARCARGHRRAHPGRASTRDTPRVVRR